MVEISPYYRKQYHCPVCEMIFESFAVRSSKINLAQRESDFHPCYRGPSPLHYSVIICPVCNYAATAKRFDERLPMETMHILTVALQLLADKRADFTGLRSLAEVLDIMSRAIDIAIIKQDEEDQLASLYLYKAWIAREAGDSETELDCLTQTLHKLLYVYNHRSRTPAVFNELQLPYLIGELHFRLGDYEEAVKWFIHTVGLKEIKTQPQIEKLARDRWSEAREAFSQAAEEERLAEEASAGISNAEAQPEADNGNILGKMVQSISSPSILGRSRRSRQQQLSLEPKILDWLHRLQDAGPEDATLELVLNTCLSVIMNSGENQNIPASSWKDRDSLAAFLVRERP